MGKFLNPDNSAFQASVDSEIYVDKSGIINYTNRVANTRQAFICNSRPRRFGKSMTADMLTAYYSKGCDSEELFSGLEISQSDNFRKHLNKYDVIHFDVQWFVKSGVDVNNVVSLIQDAVISELREAYPGIIGDSVVSLADALSDIHEKTKNKFVVIIDEWDFLIRDEAHNSKIQDEYINFLRVIFKGTEPTKYIALAYMTGILPIKRLKTQSSLNNFRQFTMLAPGAFAEYIGFTEDEVLELCNKYGRDYSGVKHWYDGYLLAGCHVYNPNAVVNFMLDGTFQSYWSQTSTFESVRPFIDMDFDGLRTDIISMLSGSRVEVDTNFFQNDMVTFKCKDDVLTLLIHLGYLAYDFDEQAAFIPNEEIRQEFISATKRNKWSELNEFEMQSDALLQATLDLDAEAVASGIEKIHSEYASVIRYNDENSLSSVLTLAYLSSMQWYFRPVRELPTGRGFADFVYVPKPRFAADFPALVVELKWNEKASTALQQIKERHYTDSLLRYTGDIILVGISYDKKSKQHTCVIEKLDKEE